MPKRPTRGVKGVYIELPPELVAECKAFGEARNESFRDVVIAALRRHLRYPPPPPPPPSPPPEPAPFPDEEVQSQPSRRKKESR